MPDRLTSVRSVIERHRTTTLPRFERLWQYFRNPMRLNEAGRGRWYRQAQEVGLPARVSGETLPGFGDRGRREVVIENDIAWRVQTMIDFMFGKPVRLRSTCADEAKREDIERALENVWEASGGISLLQDIALLGHVYGHVDLLVRVEDGAGRVRVEVIEPKRGVPLVDSADYRKIDAYAITHEQVVAGPTRVLDRLLTRRFSGGHDEVRRVSHVVTPESWQVYHDDALIEERPITQFGGLLPIVHIQNLALPFSYEGLGEVEALIPLQDELNTRLSDRACRVTMQSFKMYLAKGVDGFDQSPVGPGQVWSTDNPMAQITEFGGDAHSPSEEAHILEIREAMDKVSGVPPLASGVVRAKIGNLTSATALRITMMGLIAKTARKRVTYGRGIAEASRLILAALDHAGVLATNEDERGIRLEWPDPIPLDERDLIANVSAKERLGVDRQELLSELGHAASDPGIA